MIATSSAMSPQSSSRFQERQDPDKRGSWLRDVKRIGFYSFSVTGIAFAVASAGKRNEILGGVGGSCRILVSLGFSVLGKEADRPRKSCYRIDEMSEPLVTSNLKIMGGTPVIRGTRVPVSTLFHYLMDGLGVDEFLDHFPTVRREDALAILDRSREQSMETLDAS